MEKTNVHLAGSQEYAPAARPADECLLPAVGWISVEERLPGVDESVLTAVLCSYKSFERGTPPPETEYEIRLGFRWRREGGRVDWMESECEQVTHWMPLPAAPSGVSESAGQMLVAAAQDVAEAPEPNEPEQHQPEQQAEGRS